MVEKHVWVNVMNKAVPIGIASVTAIVLFLGFAVYDSKPEPPVTQQDLRVMIDDWMNNPDENDREQRIEIMKAYYAFEESGQKLTTDQDGLAMLNQIRKMVSLDIPKEELDQIKQNVKEELKMLGFDLEE